MDENKQAFHIRRFNSKSALIQELKSQKISEHFEKTGEIPVVKHCRPGVDTIDITPENKEVIKGTWKHLPTRNNLR